MSHAFDEEMMGLALEEGRLALGKGIFPVGAVFAVDGRIVGRAHKSMISSELSHAEMNLFKQVFDDTRSFSRMDGLTLYTTLEPCIMCFGTMLHLPVARLVFAMEDAYGGCASVALQPPPPRHKMQAVEIRAGVRREEARQLFRTFFDTTTEAYWVKGGAPQLQESVRVPN